MKEEDLQRYFDEKITSFERINHVGNNILYKVALPSGNKLLKKYSKFHAQNWPRGEREFKSLKYLWEMGFREIPKPFGFYPKDNIGIYSFEDGRILKQEEVGEREILALSDFIVKLHSLDARGFPIASTAVLCPDDYAKDLEIRIKNLEEQSNHEKVNAENKRFLYKDIAPFVKKLVVDFRKKYSKEELSKELPLDQQRLNLGDFGIHNVLISENKYVFLDFEYFGREDPVKELLGFLHHDKHLKISNDLKKKFVENYLRKTNAPASLEERMYAADPMKGATFLLVYLNVLKSKYLEQLRGQGADIESVVQERIAKAKYKLENISFF